MKFRTQSVQHIVELLGSRRASAGRTRSLDLSLNRGSESTWKSITEYTARTV